MIKQVSENIIHSIYYNLESCFSKNVSGRNTTRRISHTAKIQGIEILRQKLNLAKIIASFLFIRMHIARL
jgi:hypothetical protein